MIQVPDVSEFQGSIDWPTFVGYLRRTYNGAAGIVRVCYGDLHVDAQADRNIDGARAAGADWLAWYLYLIAGRDPVAQADTFARVLRTHGGLRAGEAVVVDDEESTGGSEAGRVNAALDELDRQFQIPNPGQEWWYSGLNFAIAHDLPAARGHRIIAAYQATEPTAVAHDLWQSTDAAHYPGIAGPVDSSIFHGSIGDLIALTGGLNVGQLDDIQALVQHIDRVLTSDTFNQKDSQGNLLNVPWMVSYTLAGVGLTLERLSTLSAPVVDVNALAVALGPHLAPAVDEAKLVADLAALLPGADVVALTAALRKVLGPG